MKKMNRRTFMQKATVLSAGLASIVDAATMRPEAVSKPVPGNVTIETRPIGKHNISRLIIGGNPFSGGAHAEPLRYSRELFRKYFTPDKVAETLSLAEQHGINTFLGRIDEHIIGLLKHYQKTTGRMIPWIAQTAAKPHKGATKSEILENIKLAADNGAIGIYFHGQSADYLVQQGKIAEIEEYLNYIRKLGVLAGVGGHEITTIEACEKAQLMPDFYMKTFNRLEYCCPNFERTKEFMATVKIPWIAFKVLAAGRMKPEEGFQAALQNGADFLCVGMFDFQIERDVKLFKTLV